jgi:glycosyltransferase involved in cell wall biosynthesis
MLALSTVVMTAGVVTADAYPALKRTKKPVVSFYPPARPVTPLAEARRPGPVTFGCLANINPQKGYDFLIRAFSAAALGDEARLQLRGAVADGHERLHDELRRAVTAAGSASIDLQTRRTTPEVFLPHIDVFVLGSDARSEGTPTAIIEAMHFGLPVIATRVGAVPELVEDGVTGYLVDPGDLSLMARRIRRLATDAELRRSMGDRGRAKATEKFSSESTLDVYRHAYSVCLVGARAAN